MRELLAGFRRGRARSYAEHGPPPPFIHRRQPPQQPPPGRDDTAEVEAAPWDIPPDAPAPDAAFDDPPLDDAPSDDAAGTASEEDKRLLVEMAERIEELEARALDLTVECDQAKERAAELSEYVEELETRAPAPSSDDSAVLEGVRRELHDAQAANNDLKAELRDALDARGTAETAGEQLRKQVAELHAEAKRRERKRNGDLDKLWRDLAKLTHPDKAAPDETGGQAMERIYKAVKATIDRLKAGYSV